MKIRTVAATVAATVLLFPGTAHADPMGDLKYSPLYKVGKIKATCATKLVKGTTRSSTQKYVDALVVCMNTTWKAKLAKIDIDFPQIKGVGPKFQPAWVKARDDYSLLHAVTRHQSVMVMMDAGIMEASQAVPGEEMSSPEQIRLLSLQAECLGATFLKNIWTTQGRTAAQWKTLLARVAKDEQTRTGWWGSAASRTHWLQQGFKSADPASCNVWKAPASKVK